MRIDNRGLLSQIGGIMYVENAFVEEVSTLNRTHGYLIISYAVPGRNGTTSIEQLRLNVSRNTVVLNSFGVTTCLCDIRKGMWIDAVFSSAMTRSIPPQSNAYLIVMRRDNTSSMSVTTDRISIVDANSNAFYTGNPNNINTQMRFNLANASSIRDVNGNPIRLSAIRPGQLARITHASFQTASIPPQTTAFYVQLLRG